MNTNILHSDIHAVPATIPGQYLSVLSECVDDFGIKQEHWLSGIEEKTIIKNCATQDISFEIFETLALRATNLSKNPALGFSVGQRMSLTSHGVLGYALMHCGNLLDAAKFVEKYLSIRLPIIHCRTCYQGDELVLSFKENAPMKSEMLSILIDGLLLTVKNSLDQLMPSLQHQTTVCFPSPPHSSFPYQSLFNCVTKFNCSMASIRISKHLMLEEIPNANFSAYQEAESLCQKALTLQKPAKTFKNRIQKKLLEQPSSFPKLDVVASWFNLTPRTLHRRLLSENTSYKDILDETKKSLAVSYLIESDMPIKEISYFLGYKETSNFRRAFKRWDVLSPVNYRKEHKQ